MIPSRKQTPRFKMKNRRPHCHKNLIFAPTFKMIKKEARMPSSTLQQALRKTKNKQRSHKQAHLWRMSKARRKKSRIGRNKKVREARLSRLSPRIKRNKRRRRN